MKGNVIVGQSGGPTAAINSSLAGVFCTAKERGAKKVYGMRHGILGLLNEDIIDLGEQITSELDVELLKRTPAAFLGSCRFKLPRIADNQEMFDKIFDILKKFDIEVFIYTGGNDSMDTIKKLSDYALIIGSDIKFVGCPKTIDNDLPLTDHTPGFGSAAKYIGTSIKEIIKDSQCIDYGKGLVTIVEIMGRNAGWLTGAACLAKGEDCDGCDLIYLPEVDFDIEDFKSRIAELLKKKTSVVVAVSEGIKTSEGKYVCEYGSSVDFVDSFGHKQLTGTASFLANMIASELGCKSRAVEFSILQRAASHVTSRIDLLEAFAAGGAAVKAGDEGESGVMVIFERVSEDPYQCTTNTKDVHKIANFERVVPREWITEDGTNVTDDFDDYVKPLIGGEVPPIMVNGIPRHLYIK